MAEKSVDGMSSKVDDSLELACEPEKQVSFEKQERSDATAVEACT